MMDLYGLIANYRGWLKYFTRRDFPSRFEEYKSVGEPIIASLEDPVAAAAVLIEKLENDWSSQKIRLKVRSARETDKMLICMFFNPMAMAVTSPNGKVLADELCRLFCEKYPKERYQVGTYELYMEGFKPTFLGFRIG